MTKKPLLVPFFNANPSGMRQLRDLWVTLNEKEKEFIRMEAEYNLKRIKESFKFLYENGIF